MAANKLAWKAFLQKGHMLNIVDFEPELYPSVLLRKGNKVSQS